MDSGAPWESVVMARVRAGDPAALAEVYDQYSGFVFALGRRVTRDAHLAEELTEEVFCQLWERPGRFDPERGTLRSFIGAMAHRRAVDCVRHEGALRRREQSDRERRPDARLRRALGDAEERSDLGGRVRPCA